MEVQENLRWDIPRHVTVNIGAFRFVSTNLAVGGGGLFGDGFVSVAGEIPIDEVARELASYRIRVRRRDVQVLDGDQGRAARSGIAS